MSDASYKKRGADSWMEVGRLAELGLLSSTLVHELKQPLFAIKATLQVNEPNISDARSREMNALLMGQVRQMEKILEAAGGLVQRPGDWSQPFAVEAPLQAARDALAPRARQLGVELQLRLAADLPVLKGNPVAMQQVLVNLLQNALDAVADIAAPQLELQASREDGGVAITLTDNGVGITEAQQARIFEPFFTTKPPGRGTGLGLSIARRLVTMAKGTMAVSSRPGRTAIRLWYPLEIQP